MDHWLPISKRRFRFLKVASDRRRASCSDPSKAAVRGRYSIIGLKPDRFGCVANAPRSTHSPHRPRLLPPRHSTPCAAIAECRIELPDRCRRPRFCSVIGYDMVRLMERLPNVNPDSLRTPDAMLVRPTSLCVRFGEDTSPLYAGAPRRCFGEAAMRADGGSVVDASTSRLRSRNATA
jgi:anthranilate synthase component 1